MYVVRHRLCCARYGRAKDSGVEDRADVGESKDETDTKAGESARRLPSEISTGMEGPTWS